MDATISGISRRRRERRIVYAAGPGDIAGTYWHWKQGQHDPSQLALTYSGQFFDVCRDAQVRAYVLARCEAPAFVRDEMCVIEHRIVPFYAARGVLYHLGQIWYVLSVLVRTMRFRADLVIMTPITDWFLLSLYRVFGIQVVPTLECALWSAGCRPRQIRERMIQFLNGWFWRHVPLATIFVSPECERQVRDVAGHLHGDAIQIRAQYRRGLLDRLPEAPPHDARQFRVMFAGTMKRSKGVFDLVEVADRLQKQHPDRFAWELCGGGSDLESVQAQIKSRSLGAVVTTTGPLEFDALIEAYGRCHVVVVPTTSQFAEGLNKVAVEGALARRPVITSVLSNALDVLHDAIVEVPPDDINAYVDVLVQLASDRVFYERKCRACEAVQKPFYDRTRGWACALKRIITGHDRATSTKGRDTVPVRLTARRCTSHAKVA